MGKIPVVEAFKFAFKPKDWIKRVGIYLTIFIGVQMVSFFLQFLTGGVLNIASLKYTDTSVLSVISSGVYFALYLAVILPTSIYTYGYSLETMKNVVKGKTPYTPLHKNIGRKFKLGVINMFCLNLFPWLVMGFAIMLEILAFVAMIGALKTVESGLNIFSTFGGAIGVIILALIVITEVLFIGAIYVPIAKYLYIKTDSILSALNPTNVFDLLGKYRKEILTAGIVVILVNIAAAIASIFTLFCVVLIGPLVQAYMYLVNDYIYGTVFKEIDK
ncbi:DUF4013 domain-containing protein [Candidatus Nomurabacteria bacterium]|nr:DUF4013 domain-containing protein [Candidatus Nomurabacteria bacterium]